MGAENLKGPYIESTCRDIESLRIGDINRCVRQGSDMGPPEGCKLKILPPDATIADGRSTIRETGRLIWTDLDPGVNPIGDALWSGRSTC